ncbi:SLC13 family permease [Actinospongicola halichondriae]|uniref:SLC13 family permease n=1 Tax=Actinospongicola halichondriae TaxID=3236844 RepID=UPI003D3D942E
MSGDEWTTLIVLVAMLGVLVVDRFPPAGVVFGATFTLLITDVIEADVAFSGFSNSAPLTVAALYVLARGAQKTGMLTSMTSRLLGDGTGRRAMTRFLVPTAGASAFFPNTPLVAMLIPDVLGWCRRHGVSPSKYLMPLSFAALLGGVVTVLGTSTNLVISGLLDAEPDSAPLSVFEMTKVGLPVAAIGLLLLLLVGDRLVPARLTPPESAEANSREFSMTMQVVAGGPLDGSTVADAGLRDLQGVFLVQIERDNSVVSPVAPDRRIDGGDVLTFVGNVEEILDLQRRKGLRSTEEAHVLAVDSPDTRFFEVVIGRSSPLVGSTIRDSGFRGTYQAAVVALHRSGHRVAGKLGGIRLRNGDTLLLLAKPDFRRNWHDKRDFLVVAPVGGESPAATSRAPIVAVVTAAVILLSATNVLPLLEGAILGAAALIVSRTLTFVEAREAIDIDVIILIASAFGLGGAMDSTGLAQRIADGLSDAFGGFGSAGVIFGVVLATAVLTELVTNNAAAIVMFPIAIASAGVAEVDPRAMAIAVAVAASASFLTPIGYQTNTMVYGPGGYRFLDYARVGAPLTATVLVGTTVMTAITG